MTTSKDDRTLVSADPKSVRPGGSFGELQEGALPPSPAPSPPSRRVPVVAPGPIFTESSRFVEQEPLAVRQNSVVLRALDKDLGREVAIKLLAREASDGPEAERFIEEARINGQLEHPYIVPVYELGADERGGRFLCMRLVRGESLERTLERMGVSRLEPDRLVDLLQVFTKICDAVAFAHSRGVVHRDIKPSNVMVGDFGQVYLLDWGVARPPTRASSAPEGLEGPSPSEPEPLGALIGTPCYMAPEQLRGQHDKVDERTDIFGLGAMLYEILAGRPPHLPENVNSILRGSARFHIRAPELVVPGAQIPTELSRIALRAMAHDPVDRYQTVDELKGEIERFQRGAWHLPRRWVPAGTIVVDDGEAGDEAFIIVDGRCAAFRVEDGAEVVLREMGPGEVFGETAIFSSKPRTASVRAVTDVVLMVVTSEILSNALGLNFWMGSFVRALAERFREVDERLRRHELEARRRSVIPPAT